MGARVAVAIETPTHAEGRHLRDDLHLVDAAVARNATDSCRHVHVMGEVSVVGKLVNANPAHRPAGLGAFPNRREHLAVPLDGLMTVHARLRGRNVRNGRDLDRGVTVSAIETQLTDVEFVAVRDGLNGTVAHVCVPRRKVVPDASDRERRNKNACDGRRDREFVPPGRENLCQRLGLRGAGGQLHPTAQTTHGGDPGLLRPRVRYGTMMPHPRAPKLFAEESKTRRSRRRSYPRTGTRSSAPAAGRRRFGCLVGAKREDWRPITGRPFYCNNAGGFTHIREP